MNNSIGKDALRLTISKTITMSIAMLTAMLLSRFRTLEEYGTYSQLMLVVNLVTTIFMLGLPNSINYFLAGAETIDEKQDFLSIYYTLSTILGALTGLVLFLLTPIIAAYFHNSLIKNFIYVLAVYPWTRIIISSIDHVLIVYGRLKLVMLFRILNSTLILSIIVIVELLNLTFNHYMVLYICLQAAIAISVYVIVCEISGKLKIHLKFADVRKILKFSLPLGLASVVGTLSIQLDKLVIGRFFSTEDIAIYSNAAREMPVTMIVSSLTAILMPRFVRLLKDNETNNAITLWGNSIELSFILLCFFSFGLVAFAPDVIALLYSEKYLPGVDVFRVYSLVLLLRVTYFGIILNATGKTKFIFYSSILSLVLNVTLNYIFYLSFGFIGPAIATFLSILLVQTLQLIVTAKIIGFRFSRIFPWQKMGEILLINFFMALLFAKIKKTVGLEILVGSILESVILGIVWGIVYFVIVRKRLHRNWSVLNE